MCFKERCESFIDLGPPQSALNYWTTATSTGRSIGLPTETLYHLCFIVRDYICFHSAPNRNSTPPRGQKFYKQQIVYFHNSRILQHAPPNTSLKIFECSPLTTIHVAIVSHNKQHCLDLLVMPVVSIRQPS